MNYKPLREDVLQAMTCRLVEVLSIDVDAAALAVNDLTCNVPELAQWIASYPGKDDFEENEG